ncbi:MAG: hypothetical protein E7425_00085 [Ruminococcaceae bacterium]|nr:hypothetical protein [Oscillospiraceae bacterium]
MEENEELERPGEETVEERCRDFDLVECPSEPEEDEPEERSAPPRPKTGNGRPMPAVSAAQRGFIESDVREFTRQYPQFGTRELSELESNPQFRRFCGTRFGREPLAELYGDYLTVVGDAGEAAVSKASRRSARSTGGGVSGSGMLTAEQRRVLKEWNAEHPEMAMTAKEFLRR